MSLLSDGAEPVALDQGTAVLQNTSAELKKFHEGGVIVPFHGVASPVLTVVAAAASG